MSTISFNVGGIIFAAVLLSAQTPPAGTSDHAARFTATTANVVGAPESIRIDILRWSTDAERDKLMSAWNMKSQSGDQGGRGGRGAGRAGGRGGRGAGPSEDTPPPTPEGSLAAALQQTATVGYLWSSEVAGYALRYAAKLTSPDGRDRIILITDRRLGVMNGSWKPTVEQPTSTYLFSVIELRVNAKGEGEGRTSLTGKVAPDNTAKMIAPEDYNALPVMLTNVKRIGEHSGL